MTEVDIKYMEAAFKDKFDIEQILSADVKPAVSDGDNYVSMLYRITLDVLSSDLKPKKISVILKRIIEFHPQQEDLNNKIKEIFNKEYQVYDGVLAKIGKYLPNVDSLWAECFSYIPYQDIYFEDLKDLGYELANRFDGLDNDHALIVFRSLAKFHAASTIAIDRGEVDTKPYKKYLFVESADRLRKGNSNPLLMIVDVIRKDWGPEWSATADKLEEVFKTIPERLKEVGMFDKTRLNVFSHGDTWVNNMMFKYNSDNKPTCLKFVDFQISHYNSFGCDLSYFLSTSVNHKIKAKHLDEWIDAYCNTFASFLDSQGSTLPTPSPVMVRQELERLTPLALTISLRIRPVVMAPKEDFVPLSEMIEDSGLNSKKRRLFTNPKYTDVMKSEIPTILDILTK